MMLEYIVPCFLIWISLCTVTSHPKCDTSKADGDIDAQQWGECLVEDLFDSNRYSPLIRPVKNINDTLVVKMSIQLSQIIQIDEKNQVMKTNVWVQMYWDDYQLKWNPKEYGNIRSTRVRPEKAWKPDIVLFNNADGNYEVGYLSNVVLYSDDDVNWIPPAIYVSSCEIDVQFFPFDQQMCEMKFGSWTFRRDQLSFQFYKGIPSLDMSDYLKSGTWDIVKCPAFIENFTNPSTNEEKAMVTFQIYLRRKTLFYTVNLLIPCVLISFVTVCVFLLPADAGEKITLCISILLALVVFLLLVSKILPPSVTIPLIAKYLLFTFIMNILGISLTVIVLNRNFRTPRTHKMPKWVRFLFLYLLPKFLFMERPDHNSRWKQGGVYKPITVSSTTQHPTSRVPDITHTSTPSQHRRAADMLELTEIHHPNCRLNVSPESEDLNPSETTSVEALLQNIDVHQAADALKFITCHLQNEERYTAVLDDWKYVARVIDRFLLCVFLIVTLGGTFGILMEAPHILEFVDQDLILENINALWRQALQG
ncbi:hypothetical protein ACJMK2_042891 [Sinanodonta woodiana]|uniref:Nicotinic acetylcholine receptor beta 1 subunit n=1 Tax=Sinanodonta woodiana TaxID=1069815 RepID=A0ABD3VVY8_SINWO